MTGHTPGTYRPWFWSCSVPSPSRPSSPSTSGCPMRWPRQPQCRPICTRRPWSRLGSSCWRGCSRPWPGPGVVLAGGWDRARDPVDRGLHRPVSARPQGAAGLLHHQPPGPDYPAVRHRHAPWRRWRGSSTSSTMPPSRRPCSWPPGSSITRPAAGICAASTASGAGCPIRASWPWSPRRPWPGCRCSTAFCPKRCSLPRPWALPPWPATAGHFRRRSLWRGSSRWPIHCASSTMSSSTGNQWICPRPPMSHPTG